MKFCVRVYILKFGGLFAKTLCYCKAKGFFSTANEMRLPTNLTRMHAILWEQCEIRRKEPNKGPQVSARWLRNTWMEEQTKQYGRTRPWSSLVWWVWAVCLWSCTSSVSSWACGENSTSERERRERTRQNSSSRNLVHNHLAAPSLDHTTKGNLASSSFTLQKESLLHHHVHIWIKKLTNETLATTV